MCWNRAAKVFATRMMSRHGVPLIDLHAFTMSLIAGHGEARVLRKDRVHFTRFAYEAQGRYLAAEWRKTIPPKTP